MANDRRRSDSRHADDVVMSDYSNTNGDAVSTPSLPTVLLVDDEPNVLAGLTLHLRRRYHIVTAAGGGAALALLHDSRISPAVVVSDMNMPGMDGATFLATVRKSHPESVRILLTGQANVNSAISAINEGQVFRFLTKPCAPAQLLATVEAALVQHELLASERVLLQETLHGSIEALVEVLSLTSPVTFGRAMSLKALVGELATAVNSANVWQLEIAAMFSQLGHVTLPPEVSEKVYLGYALSEEESAMIARIPATTDRLLAHIPRLQPVRDILLRVARLAEATTPFRSDASESVKEGAQLLDLARRYLQHEVRGESPARAVALLRAREGWYTPALLDALQMLRGCDEFSAALQEIPVSMLRTGMTLAEDLFMAAGQLLAPKGYSVTASFIERCRNTREGTIVERVRIVSACRTIAAAEA